MKKRIFACLLVSILGSLGSNCVYSNPIRLCTGEFTNPWKGKVDPTQFKKRGELFPWCKSLQEEIRAKMSYNKLLPDLRERCISCSVDLSYSRFSNVRVLKSTGIPKTDSEVIALLESISVSPPPNELPDINGLTVYIDMRVSNSKSPFIQVWLRNNQPDRSQN